MERTAIPLYPDDSLEDLQRGGFRMLQKKQGFRFGMDSVLLSAYAASFCRSPKSQPLRIADLGAGCGAVSLLLAARLPEAQLVGLEIDPVSSETMKRNRILNALENRMQVVEGDIRELARGKKLDEALPPHSFDLVVSNPPYHLPGQSWRPAGTTAVPADRIACEETCVSLSEILQAAAFLLKAKGRLVMVHRANRLPDILCGLRQFCLEPKTMRLIQPLPERAPITLLISAVNQGRPGNFIIEPPLLACSQPGVWTPETEVLYGFEPPLSREKLYQGLCRDTSLSEGDVTGD